MHKNNLHFEIEKNSTLLTTEVYFPKQFPSAYMYLFNACGLKPVYIYTYIKLCYCK